MLYCASDDPLVLEVVREAIDRTSETLLIVIDTHVCDVSWSSASV